MNKYHQMLSRVLEQGKPLSRQIDLPLRSITLFLGNVHIYSNNVDSSCALLSGDDNVKFELNV